MKITTILPVSRTQYLDRVLESLKNQTRKTDNLLVIFDGDHNDFISVRNRVVEEEYDNVLCVMSVNGGAAATIADRRNHIVNIHNQIREIVLDCDWIFSIEDDGLLPENALARLVAISKVHKDAGMITGVELGRWGVPYVGAWTVDNIEHPKLVTSLDNKTSDPIIEELDACGLYCALIRADKYKEHVFFTNNGLGPDVNLGLFLRREGFNNYIDWGVPVTHITERAGKEIEIPATSDSRTVTLRLLSGSTWQSQKH